MRKGRRGIVIGGMVLSLLMGCNNGIAEELAAERSLREIGRSAENTFYSFIDLIADTLGFRVTKEKTKKEEVGIYFSGLGKKIEEVSNKLEEVAEKAAGDGSDKDGLLGKAIREAVEAAKATLSTLKDHLESLKDIGDGEKVGVAANNNHGTKPSDAELKNAFSALKGIFEIAKIQQVVKEPSSSSVTLQQASIGVASPQDGAKILSTGGGTPGAVGDKAALIVSAVSGEEILAEIVKSKDSDVAIDVGSSADASTSALKFANGHATATNLNKPEAKAAAVAGGIALRALVKSGKLAANTSNYDKAAQAAGVTAVNKLLVVVEDIIKKTVKNVIGKAKGEIDKARDSKATVQK